MSNCTNENNRTTFHGNRFANTSGYAIEYRDNPGGILYIGNQEDTTLRNTFDNCNWQAIGCFNNTKPGLPNQPPTTQINISNNRFDRHPYAGAVFVGEATSPDPSYSSLLITRNRIGLNGRLGAGITLSQVTGLNPRVPDFKEKRFFEESFRIDSNLIQFTNSINLWANGIHLSNARRLNVLRNQVNSGTWGDYRPSALHMAEGPWNLVNQNQFQGGAGGWFRIDGDRMRTLDSSGMYYLWIMGPDSTHYSTHADRWYHLAYAGPQQLGCGEGAAPAALAATQSIWAERLRIYPVPASQTLHVSGLPAAWQLRLQDLSGRTLLYYSGAEQQVQLPIQGYAPGMYLLELSSKTAQHRHVVKVQIQ